MRRSFVYPVVSFFALLCIVFIPFPFYLFKGQLSITEFIFGDLIGSVSKSIFGKPLQNTHILSDTASMYVLLLILFILAIVVAAILSQLKSWSSYRNKVFQFIYLLVFYYLALQLLKYGSDKIFKTQFYLPEPNTLYTPMGNMSRDLLYWSTMGTSHFYNVFLGSIELIAALLLLIKRTRLLGLLLSFFIILNVVAVNMAFDISVKAFSLLLFFFTLYLLVPYFRKLYQFFLSGRTNETANTPERSLLLTNKSLSLTVKCFFAAVIFLESFYPYLRSGNFNGDLAQRPYMHGAYEVKQFINGSDTLDPVKFPVRRFFIHKDSYMILQGQQDEMVDYKLIFDKNEQAYVLIDYQMQKVKINLAYQEQDSLLTIQYLSDGDLHQLTGKALDWKKLPALKKEFHWTADQ